MFFPEEIIFVPTQACNLRCPHCYVPKNSDCLKEDKALAFLEAAAEDNVIRVGFSGGEPFLRPDFLCSIISKAVEKGFLFDRLMTNGVWWKTEVELDAVLEKIHNAGFDGIIGISFDCFHNQPLEKIVFFIHAVERIWNSRNICEIVSVFKNTDCEEDDRTSEMIQNLADSLKADVVQYDDGQFALQYTETAEEDVPDEIPVVCIDYVPENCSDPAFWQDENWFNEDFCEGPGNVFFVHGNGDVAACCGYANESAELILGNINTHGYDEIKQASVEKQKEGFLKTVYVTGLRKCAEDMEKSHVVFPGKGKTKNNCLFCKFLLDAEKGTLKNRKKD